MLFRFLGENGPKILHNLQNTLLYISVSIFGLGLLSLVAGIIKKEEILRSWIVVVFLAPTFFVMAAIVFIPLIQGISLSFTNADQQNMAKMKPYIETRQVGAKEIREKKTEIIPPTFEYVAVENYVEIFAGKSKTRRLKEKVLGENLTDIIDTINVRILPNGIIWTFNMFNIIYLVTQASIEADILVTYAYRAAFRFWDIGESTAYSVLILCLLLSFCYSYWKVLKGEN